ncbi:MAG: hypothetical protein ACQEQC_05585 [Elusimicrobiota bacterium]
MKKLLSLCVTGLLVISLTGCENQTPDKLLGHTLYNPTQEVESTAKTSGYTAVMAATMGSYADGGDLASSSASSLSETSATIPEVEGPDSDGFFTVKTGQDTFYVRWQDKDNNNIIGDGATPEEKLLDTVTNDHAGDGTNGAKYFDIKGDFRELNHPEYAPELESVTIVENKPDFTFELKTTGDLIIEDGAIANGEWKSVFESKGQAVFEFTDLDIKSEPLDNGRKWYVAGGTGSGETIINNSVYTSDMTFNSAGEAEGTLRGENYEIDFLADTYNGDGWYKLDDEKHTFS